MADRKNYAPEDIDDEFWDEPQQHADLADSLYAIKPDELPTLKVHKTGEKA